MQPTQSIPYLLHRLWHHILLRRRRQFVLLLVLMLLTSFSEVLSIGAVVPFLGVLTAPERIFQMPAAQPFIQALKLTEPTQLLLPFTVAFGTAVLIAGAMRLLLLWGSARLSLATGADLSISVYRRIGDKSFKWKTHCEPTSLVLDVPSSGGDSICLSVALQNENNVMSAPYHLPCFSLPSASAIAPPQPLGITFAADTATLSFLPPEQTVVGTLLQWRRMDDNTGSAYFYAHAGQTAQDGALAYGEVDLGGVMVSGDPDQQWCFMARAIGSDNSTGSSEWSAELCGLRIPPDETYPEYLPWPVIPSPGNLESLAASYFPSEGLPAVLIGEDLVIDHQATPALLATCLGTDTLSADLPCLAGGPVTGNYSEFCPTLRAAAAPRLGFVAYRQSRANSTDLNPSEFHQVSPLIDRVQCRDEAYDSVAGGLAVIGHLEDPFFELVSFSPGSSFRPGEVALVWVDRTPHEVDLEYRYQLVYFSDDGEIVGYRTTDWATSRERN